MDATVFAVCATMHKLVAKAIVKCKFTTNANNQYLHDTVLVFKKKVGCVRVQKFYQSPSSNGTKGILLPIANDITAIRVTNLATYSPFS